MLNPIKRVWVPKKVEAPPAAAPAPTPIQAPPAPKPLPSHNMLFDEVPEPEVEEKNSDSIWAEFDSVLPTQELVK